LKEIPSHKPCINVPPSYSDIDVRGYWDIY
jgi:hypothetical protein